MNAAFCPRCASPLTPRVEGQGAEARERLACSKACGYVHYDNPLPVVAAIVEHGDSVVLVRNHGWPEGMFGLVTGFLERGETPEEGVLREVREEIGVEAELVGLVGVYAFQQRNELIVAYHVKASGELRLGSELAGMKQVPIAKLRPWPFGTGHAVKDWLARRAV